MPSIPDQLQAIRKDLATGKRRWAKVKTLLSWFGKKGRGKYVVQDIQEALHDTQLFTEPDFTSGSVHDYLESVLSHKRRVRMGLNRALSYDWFSHKANDGKEIQTHGAQWYRTRTVPQAGVET